MMSLNEGVLFELKDYGDNDPVGTRTGTTFHWTIGRNTSIFFRRYFKDGCVVTVKHLRFLANLE